MRSIQLRGRQRGLALALIGVLTVTPDAVLIRFGEAAGGARPLTSTVLLVLWAKGIFTGLAGFLIVLIQLRGSARAIIDGVRAGPMHIAVVCFFQIVIQIGFPLSFLYTSASKALLLIALNPLWAALLGCTLLKDKLAPPTLIALCFALASILVVFIPPLVLAADEGGNATHLDASEETAPRSLIGDLFSLTTGLGLASFLTASRWAAKSRPGIVLSLTPVLSNVLIFLCLLPLSVNEIIRFGPPDPLFWGVLAADGLCISIGLVCIVHAPQHAGSAEVALVLLVENFLGPLWVYFGFGEVPTLWTVVGGAMLLVTLATHEIYLGFGASQRNQASPPALKPALVLEESAAPPKGVQVPAGVGAIAASKV